ncbi:MAG: hydantoinase B/oxoprolinase family protein [Planctomycetes bacterium]|nr:hydantoinase B/oxoprolinase family protein [Planctomycetota bacterium]
METVGPVIEAITDELRETLLAEGVSPGALSQPTVTFDLCYEGQSTLITVPDARFRQVVPRSSPLAKGGLQGGLSHSSTDLPQPLLGKEGRRKSNDVCKNGTGDASDAMRHEFESRHRRLYGYHHAGRPVEIRVVRVELAARSEPFDLDATQTDDATCPAPDTTKMVVDGMWHDVPLYFREQLATGTSLRGPAIVIEKTSTIVIDDGWEGSLNACGDLILTDVTTGLGCEKVSSEADPIQLELFNNQFAAIAEQMGTTLRRTALSTNVKERLDFSCAVFTPTGDLVVNAPHIPVHLGGMSDCVKSLMADVGMLHPGDVYVTNDPYRGGSHLNDVTVITPVHNSAGERVIFFVASSAHHAEIGGRRPGSMPPDSTCLADEGVLIRAVRWLNRGVLEDDALRAVLTDAPHPSRNPEENLADIAAQVAANQTGVADLTALVERYGLGIVHGYMRHIQDAAARKTRAVLRKMADGIYSFTDRLDDGSAIRLRVTIRDDSAVFDFSGSDPVLPGNLNANRSIVTSAVLYCLRCLIDEDIPLNSGVLEPVTIVLPECFLNPAFDIDPKRCPAVAGGNVETSQRVVDTVLGALKSVAASQGTMNNVLIGNEKFGYYETICGGAGAGPGFDGADAVHTHMTNTRLTDPEVLESRYPIRVIRFAIRHGSGGAGAFRGGCGVVRELEFLETLDLSLISQRRHVAPYGVAGGGAGMMGVNRIYHAKSGVTDELPPIASVRVFAGDRLTIETPGGGGWGTKAPSPEHPV